MPTLTGCCAHAAWEAVIRIRCSKGVRIPHFHGHFFIRSTDLLALPTCDPDKALAVEMALEDNLVVGNTAYVQCALLYTASCGERRIRQGLPCLCLSTASSSPHCAVPCCYDSLCSSLPTFVRQR